MLPLFLILILSLFVFYSIRVMINRHNDLHALAFLALYIYTIFAQIGYAYFPELSILTGAYFGPILFYKYWAFMFFSFVFSFVLYRRMNPKNSKKVFYKVKPARKNYGEYVFFLIVMLLYLALVTYFLKYRGIFGYGGGTPMGGPWFGIGFLLFQSCTFILYTLFRDKSNKIKKRIFSGIAFIFCILFFVQVAIAAGTRSPILYVFIGIVFYESYPILSTIKNEKRKIFVLIFSSLFVFNMLTVLRTLRLQGKDIGFSSFSNYDSSDSKFTDQDWQTVILMQDYYVPSHTLYISMHYKFIDPIEVFKSNFYNSMILFKYPFLSNRIVARLKGSEDERGAGWSYHYFVEGYNAIGLLGVFYSALFWNLGMLLWIRLTQSNNRRHNIVMLAILSIIITDTMRGQTGTFVHNYWLILLPALLLSLLANNNTMAFFKRGRLH